MLLAAAIASRIISYAVALWIALMTLLLWVERRYRFARRYRSAVSHALRDRNVET